MTTQASDRTAILVVRLWVEPSADGLRARITRTLDAAGVEQAMSTAATPDDICAAVRSWVDAFVTGHEALAEPVTPG